MFNGDLKKQSAHDIILVDVYDTRHQLCNEDRGDPESLQYL